MYITFLDENSNSLSYDIEFISPTITLITNIIKPSYNELSRLIKYISKMIHVYPDQMEWFIYTEHDQLLSLEYNNNYSVLFFDTIEYDINVIA